MNTLILLGQASGADEGSTWWDTIQAGGVVGYIIIGPETSTLTARTSDQGRSSALGIRRRSIAPCVHQNA